MPPHSLGDTLKKFRGLWKKPTTSTHIALQSHSVATGILAVSRRIVAFGPSQLPSVGGPQESPVISTIYRNASDAVQTFLLPVQAVAGVVPGIGGIIKGVVGGMLSVLQLVDVIWLRSRDCCSLYQTSSSQRYMQNKGDIEQLTFRLHHLLRLIDDAPVARTTMEETMRQRLLRCVTCCELHQR